MRTDAILSRVGALDGRLRNSDPSVDAFFQSRLDAWAPQGAPLSAQALLVSVFLQALFLNDKHQSGQLVIAACDRRDELDDVALDLDAFAADLRPEIGLAFLTPEAVRIRERGGGAIASARADDLTDLVADATVIAVSVAASRVENRKNRFLKSVWPHLGPDRGALSSLCAVASGRRLGAYGGLPVRRGFEARLSAEYVLSGYFDYAK